MQIKPFLAIVTTLLLVAGCGSAPTSSSAKTQVVASFYPFAFIVEQVGGSFVNVENLTSPGVEPHDLELKPRQVGAVQNADLMIYTKHFQAAVDDAVDLADRSNSATIDVTKLVKMRPLKKGSTGSGEHGEDPHLWLDPQNMIAVTKAVDAKLSALDSAHTTTYAANSAALIAKFQQLDTSFQRGLADCRIRKIITTHAAFGYLAARYGLEQIPIAGIDPSNEPSPAQLAEITKLVRKDKITTIFTEELISPAIAETVAHSTGAKTATLDPIEGLSDKTANETYLTLMAKNLTALEKACR